LNWTYKGETDSTTLPAGCYWKETKKIVAFNVNFGSSAGKPEVGGMCRTGGNQDIPQPTPSPSPSPSPSQCVGMTPDQDEFCQGKNSLQCQQFPGKCLWNGGGSPIDPICKGVWKLRPACWGKSRKFNRKCLGMIEKKCKKKSSKCQWALPCQGIDNADDETCNPLTRWKCKMNRSKCAWMPFVEARETEETEAEETEAEETEAGETEAEETEAGETLLFP